ncbi:MAG TPA: phage major capsid protein [Rhizomicrobium sp.]|nr:phage major capsid protein [Rhizomicrobium sp.]
MTERNSDIESRIDNHLRPVTKSILDIGQAFEGFVGRADQTLSELTERVEIIESKGSEPGRASTNGESREHVKRFNAWLHNPRDGQVKNALGEMERRMQQKGVITTSGSGGGYAVPTEIVQDIENMERKLSPVRSLVLVRKVGTPNHKELVNLRGSDSGWVGEGGVRSETNTSALREVTPTMGELYAYPQATSESIDDMQFNVRDWLTAEAAEAFAEAEGAAVISGDGANKPTGMLHTAPVLTADFASPLRAAAAYQYIASLSTTSPAVAEIDADALITLRYALNAKYRVNATWAMNSATAAEIHKLKDKNGRYIWAQGLAAGQPDTLFGHPVAIWEQLDDIGTNKLPVAFGDFSRGYILADRTDLRITVDDNITTPGKVKFFIRRREGGMVRNNDAIKWLKTTIA